MGFAINALKFRLGYTSRGVWLDWLVEELPSQTGTKYYQLIPMVFRPINLYGLVYCLGIVKMDCTFIAVPGEDPRRRETPPQSPSSTK